MQININYLKDEEIKSLKVGDRLSDKNIEGKIIELIPKESTGWGITYSFKVRNEHGRVAIVSKEI